jgi:beta-lactamase regulating signal transducer with metallopeptidase domain
MIASLEMWLSDMPWLTLLAFFIDVTLKGVVICAVAGVVTLVLRRSSAFVRNTVWVFALVGLVLLPAFCLLSPLWNLPIIPELASWGAGSYTSNFEKPEPAPFVGPPFDVKGDATVTAGSTGGPASAGVPWYAWAILAWVGGSVLYLCWCLLLHAEVRRVVGRARAAGPEWTALLGDVSEELELTRNVRLLESKSIKAAITVGIFHPVVVVPVDSEEWTDNRRRLVLFHELAHVKRWDTLTEFFALIATVVYWFNPLVWLAVRQLRIERETECDNAVLRTGAKPSDYAELLMNIAADLGAMPVWRMSTVSQNSNLKDRLMDILNQRINRSRGSRRSAVLIGVLVLALVLPISAAGIFSARTEAQTDDKAKQEEKAQTDDKAKTDEQLKEEQMKKEEMKKGKKVKMSADEKAKMSWEKMCENENSAACYVGKTIKKKGTEIGVKTFYKLKQANETENAEWIFKEKEFNMLGYVFLNYKKVDAAIAVFELNVKEYPASWNVYDSLGEAYMVAERYDESRKYYEKALAMNPEAESAKKALATLEKKSNVKATSL